MTIGHNLQYFREQKGLSLSEAANRSGVSKSYLSTIERGIQSNPSLQFLNKIAPILDVYVTDLLDIDIRSPYDVGYSDEDWLALIHEAQEKGITKDQFQQFIQREASKSRYRQS